MSEALELAIIQRLNQIWQVIQLISTKEGTILSALSDLQAAEAAIGTAVANAVTLIQQLQAASGGAVASADVEAVVAQLTAAAATLNAAVAPAPPAPPAPPANP